MFSGACFIPIVLNIGSWNEKLMDKRLLQEFVDWTSI